MAIELADAYVSINPSTRGLKANLSRELSGPLATEGDRAGRAASSRFGGTFVAGMAGIARRAGLALAAGGALAGGFGIKVAADFQQTTIAFEGILGSAEEAKRILGDLREFATRTPFELTGLADSAKNLLAVGFAADDIIPTMTTLGNVAATLGVGEAEIAGTVRALGQMKGKGKASAEELQQISEQIPGFSAIGAIAKGMGISVAEAFETMAKGAVPADDAIRFILEGMEDFPGAAGAMERQSKTLNGVISTFKDTLATTAIDFITPYLPALSRGVQAVGGFIGDVIVPGIQSFIDIIGDLVETHGPKVSRFFRQELMPVFSAIGDLITQHFIPTLKGLVRDGLEALSEWWSRNGDNVKGFFRDVGDIFQDVIKPALEAVGDIIWKTLLPALKDIAEWIVTNKPALIGVAAFIGTVLVAAFLAWAASAASAALATLLAAAPVIAIAVLIGLLAAALIYVASKWNDVGSTVFKVRYALARVGDVIMPVVNFLKKIAELAYKALFLVLALGNALADLGPVGVAKKGLGGLLQGLGIVEPRAAGGPVIAGRPYIVGDGGRPELFVPRASGTILPQVPGGQTFVTNIYNPTPEPASDSVRALRRVALQVA